jgi:biofilm PGA synthesis lipoprotein PgaB
MKDFRLKAFSLALPVVIKDPVEPVTSEKRPQLTISLSSSTANLDQLACYIGNKKMKIQWQDPKKKFTIQSEKDLPQGRSRYNCTAPTTEGDRYYWFSHQWLRL